ncbi:MAG: ubiquitin-like protein Pup [Actinobacteria bacterium]|nr:ubiquitin-like protein Pup [Actinomycetota bacterium]
MTEKIRKSNSNINEVPAEEIDDLVVGKNDHAENLKADLDQLLDDIDSILETNAEDFVNSYVQKGGE